MTQEKGLMGNPAQILLVEDNADHAKIVKRSLKNHRISNVVCHVQDGETALDYLFRRGRFADPKSSPRPDVILLDLRLPKIDGLGVLKQIKESPHLLRIPVVILTTSHAEQDRAKAYDYHANSYLVKPLDFEKFSALMNDLGFYWLVWNAGPCNPDEGD
ncbi:MAG: response regulator [Pseudomonadota bacterium]